MRSAEQRQCQDTRLEGGEIQPDRAEDVEAREHQDEDGRARITSV